MNKDRQYGLLKSDLTELVSILRKNNKIAKIILFGSRAKGTFRNGADVDLSISGNHLTLDDVIKANVEFEKLDLPYRIDLVIYDRIKEAALIDHINRVGIVLFDRETAEK